MITLTKNGTRKATTTINGLCIMDAEQAPRWIWPAASSTPLFLELYQATTLRQRLFVLAIRLVFMLRLQRIVFRSIELDPGRYGSDNGWAVFTGTQGPNRKQVTVREDGTITKTAVTETAAGNLRNEIAALEYFAGSRESFTFTVPELRKTSGNSLTMERLDHRGTWSRFNATHAAALGELRRASRREGTVGSWEEWGNIRTNINGLRNDRRREISPEMVDMLEQMATAEDSPQKLEFSAAHGDFTPWNTLRLKGDRLGIIDWELARPAMPAGFDYFHFHLQQGIMVERKTWREIYADIQRGLSPAVRKALFGRAEVAADRYLRLYLLYHISYYLGLYQQQPDWHRQVYWQLDVWSDALHAMLPTADQRKALIGRLLEVLACERYAVLKLADENPVLLSEDSDLDVLVGNAATAEAIVRRLKSFPHIMYCKAVRKSFMLSLFVSLKSGQVLSLDLIWKLKRKAVVFMDVAGLIERSRSNAFGVSVVCADDTERYLRLFYGLNRAAVPTRFGQVPSPLPAMEKLPENKGLRGLFNRLAYASDSLRTALFNSGFVVTFSGVDGAGKSTVIDHVVHMLDKKFRRPVKVLRHRPSVLPILSALRYGRAEAERKSVERLPRTGGNTSALSSALRFAYYYADYLLGQWYVHFRYVMRGYTVVYDRYYYDFMVDGRRSNLELPRWVTTAGFWLIKKPALNFFLYADPDVILARKQELDRGTIVTLTHRYRSLFTGYQRTEAPRVFAAIENVVLEDTLEQIGTALHQKIR